MSEQNAGFGRKIRHPNSPKPKRPRVSAVVIALGACVVLLLGVVVWLAMPDPEQEKQDREDALKSQFQEECYTDLRDQLRDPDSAKFESESGVIIDGDDGKYTLLGEGRARNGFGGMNNFTIACTAQYDEETESFDVDSEISD